MLKKSTVKETLVCFCLCMKYPFENHDPKMLALACLSGGRVCRIVHTYIRFGLNKYGVAPKIYAFVGCFPTPCGNESVAVGNRLTGSYLVK